MDEVGGVDARMDFDEDLSRCGDQLAAEADPGPGRSVLVVVPDRTRPTPLDRTLPAVLEGLLARGTAAEHIEVAIASGSHVASALDVARLGVLPAGVRILRHDAEGPWTSVGTTRRGTEVRVHPALIEADAVLVLGGTALHYFAGFGGGGKMLFPGLGERRSIAANHRLALAPEWGLAAGVEPGRTHDNPVWLDLREAHQLLPRARHLTLLAEGDRWRGCRWSDFLTFDRLCEVHARNSFTGERHAMDIVIASCGAPPRDLDVVQAHKALFHAALYVKDAGEILLRADCPEGIGSPALARWLALPDRATLERQARAAYDLNAQTAISLAAIASRARVTWIGSHAPAILERWGIAVVRPEAGMRHLDRARAMRGEAATVVTLPVATDCIPLPSTHL